MRHLTGGVDQPLKGARRNHLGVKSYARADGSSVMSHFMQSTFDFWFGVVSVMSAHVECSFEFLFGDLIFCFGLATFSERVLTEFLESSPAILPTSRVV